LRKGKEREEGGREREKLGEKEEGNGRGGKKGKVCSRNFN